VFDTESSGKITVRAIFDHENRMQRFLGQPDCNERRDAGEIQFLDLSHTAECYRRAAGPVEYCEYYSPPAQHRSYVKEEVANRWCAGNIEDQLGQQKDSLDTSWKHGGSLFWRCTIFDIFKTPMGEHAGGSPMPAPEIWPDPKKICEGNVESCEPQKWPEGKELWPLEQAGMHPVEDIGT
jgi:hypothetical protein